MDNTTMIAHVFMHESVASKASRLCTRTGSASFSASASCISKTLLPMQENLLDEALNRDHQNVLIPMMIETAFPSAMRCEGEMFSNLLFAFSYSRRENCKLFFTIENRCRMRPNPCCKIKPFLYKKQ